MPSFYAHHVFGEICRKEFPARLKSIVDAAEGAFHLGLQGPDFFFYGSVLRDKVATRFGEGLHAYNGREIFDRFLEPYKDREIPPAVYAYLIGFLGHYTLDVIAHPYVFRTQKDEAHHLALETDFDSYLLRQEGRDPWKARLHQFSNKDQQTVEAVRTAYAPWAEEIPPERVASSVKDVHNIRKLMRTPNAPRTWFIRTVMKKMGLWNKMFGMLTIPPTEDNPTGERWVDKPAEAMSTLEELHKQARPAYLENLHVLEEHINKGQAWPPFFEHDFSGEVTS